MRSLLVCTSLCLVGFASVGNPEPSVGAVDTVAATPLSAKSDMRPKDQTRFEARDGSASHIPTLDWPVLLRDDLDHLALAPPQTDDEQDSAPADNSPAQASETDVCAALADAAAANHLPVAFFLRLIWQESRFDPHSVSRAGAQGMAQFMPETAAEEGLQDPFDPMQALPASARMLSNLEAKFGNLGLAAAAYNAGPKRIQDWLTRRAKLPHETRDYVLKVTGRAPELWKRSAQHSMDLRIPPRAPCRDVVMPAGAVEADASAVPLPVPAPFDKEKVASVEKEKTAHRGRRLLRMASAETDSAERRHRRR